MDKNRLLNILSSAYDQKNWQDVLVNVFNVKSIYQIPIAIPLPANDKAESAFELGKFYTADDRLAGIYQINIKPGIKLEKNKVGIRQLLRNIYKYEVDGALIVFVQDGKWRLSFVSEIRKFDENGEVVKHETEPKRYTYLLGEGEKTRTARDRLFTLAGKPINLEDIREAFSVEKLNEEFYQTVAHYFYTLVGATAGKGKKQMGHERLMRLPDADEKNNRLYHEFAVRLIGRIIFCWFLKMKKSQTGNPLLPENLLSSDAVKNNYGYYKNILERLFFQTLNTPMNERIDNLPPGCDNIPFLNGGLFEPHNDDYFKPDNFSGISSAYALEIPDQWFFELYTELEKYNFTIDENSINDMEVSVDPEMLGRIFENLLAEIDPDSGETARKATGSFYTPREIVDYMATESLVHFLHKETGIEKDKIELLFKSDIELEDETIKSKSTKLLDALDKVKILDPACGSGAFPMGVLQKIVTALQKLDPDCKLWIKRQLDRIENPILKKQIGEKLKNASVEYARKLGVIQNSLYGVDIQPIAAEISKLRCFLTLVVDEKIDETKENRGVEALPNLEFKFVTADTLIKLPEELDHGGLFNLNDELDKLKDLRKSYLQSYGKEKAKLKKEFEDLQEEMLAQQFTMGGSVDYESKAYKISSWKPFSHEKSEWFDPLWMFGIDGFDIVIGNPPYVQLQKDGGRLADMYKNGGYKTFQRTGDIYALFYESGINSLNENGNLCFITSNKWMRAGYGKSLRNFFLTKNPIMLIDLGPGIFKQATVDANILLIEKGMNNKKLKAVVLKKIKNESIDISSYFKDKAVELNSPNEESWFIGSDLEQKLKEKIEKIGTTLKDWDVKIFRGITSGLNEAFIIDTATKEKLCKDDPKNIEIIKPILRGKDITRYGYAWSDYWTIFIPWHFPLHKDNSIQGASLKAEEELEKQYPAIYKHLLQFKDQLKKRNQDETGIRYEWYAMQRCANTYYEEFDKIKVIYNEIMTDNPEEGYEFPNFSYDNTGMYLLNTAYLLICDNPEYIIAVLNSKLGKMLVKNYVTQLQRRQFRMLHQSVELFPIPLPSKNNQLVISAIEKKSKEVLIEKKENPKANTTAYENEIDRLVYELYELTEEEIKIVEGEQ
ncbi:MAG: N-6 DNA methylase [Candidatus Delongbacteria bacterium]|nr:N-6 DNA methylase [Candidatus Delongbacteria bacterium]